MLGLPHTSHITTLSGQHGEEKTRDIIRARTGAPAQAAGGAEPAQRLQVSGSTETSRVFPRAREKQESETGRSSACSHFQQRKAGEATFWGKDRHCHPDITRHLLNLSPTPACLSAICLPDLFASR